jgi:serine/threonine-protein kinase
MEASVVSRDSRLAAFKNAIASRYLIDLELGRGGMAFVYLARDVRLGRSVAVKVLAPRVASPATATAFHREIGHTLGLEHPNILPLFDAGEAQGLPFYVMRHVKGGSLRQRLDHQGPFGMPEALGIVRQTAAALAHAHDRRILHCDVKPENILLEGHHVYLADFGISRAIRADAFAPDGNTTLAGGGTAAYVSPEQALGERAIDGRADLYSLACVVYEMLTGEPPVMGGSLAFPRAVPAAARGEIARALSLEPGRRQPSVVEFAAALRAPGRDRGLRGIVASLGGLAYE